MFGWQPGYHYQGPAELNYISMCKVANGGPVSVHTEPRTGNSVMIYYIYVSLGHWGFAETYFFYIYISLWHVDGGLRAVARCGVSTSAFAVTVYALVYIAEVHVAGLYHVARSILCTSQDDVPPLRLQCIGLS